MTISRNWVCLSFLSVQCDIFVVLISILCITGRVIPTKRTLGLAPAPAVPPRLLTAEATPLSKAPELQPEVFEGDGQVDFTRGINKMGLDGQW